MNQLEKLNLQGQIQNLMFRKEVSIGDLVEIKLILNEIIDKENQKQIRKNREEWEKCEDNILGF